MRLASPIPHKRARIEIIPLIDIMFFLLASFMMVSLSQTHMKGIKVALPAPNNVPPPPVKDYVSISAEGMARHGDVITVLDKVRRAGIQKVGYQIRAASGGAAAPPGTPGAPGAPPPPAPPPPH